VSFSFLPAGKCLRYQLIAKIIAIIVVALIGILCSSIVLPKAIIALPANNNGQYAVVSTICL
jgi:hypothetical protein